MDVSLEHRVSALEMAVAVNDERWRQVVEKLDEANKDRVDMRNVLLELTHHIMELKLSNAHTKGTGIGISAVFNWGLTIATSLGTLVLAIIELSKNR